MGVFILLHSFSRGWDDGTAQDYVMIQKLTLYLIQSFENSRQVLPRSLWRGENWDHTGLAAERWVRRGISGLPRPSWCSGTHIADDGGDTGAAYGHQHFLQAKGARAALGLPPQDQELLLDGNRIHGAVFLPFGIDAARVPALGLRNLWGEPVGVAGNAAGGADKSRWWDKGERDGQECPTALGTLLQGGISEQPRAAARWPGFMTALQQVLNCLSLFPPL